MKNYFDKIDSKQLYKIISQAIKEDVGPGDLTTLSTINKESSFNFNISSREEIVICGIPVVKFIFENFSNIKQIKYNFYDGLLVTKGQKIIEGRGNAQEILRLERTILNLLQHLSGIATETRKYVDCVKGTKAKILDTRKTIPNFRILQKYAVRTGGGHNHRFGLYDQILIKDNHIAVCGGIKEAVYKAKQAYPKTIIEVECDTIEQVKEALTTKADIIMLDNMTLDMLNESVTIINSEKKIEASGNVNLSNVREIALTGVDFISIGKLTHSVRASDIGLDVN